MFTSKLVFIPILINFVSIYGMIPVQAHFLGIDGDVGITLHVDPEDDPIVGQPSTIYPDLSDKSGNFDAARCKCTITISLNKQKLGEFSFVPNEPVSYQFDKKGLYTLEFAGKSINNSFADFSISYDIRVARQSAKSSSQSSNDKTLQYIIFGGGLVGFIVLIGYDIIKDRQKIKQP